MGKRGEGLVQSRSGLHWIFVVSILATSAATARAAAGSDDRSTELPPGLTAAIIETIQRTTQPEYAVQTEGREIVALQPGEGTEARFEREGTLAFVYGDDVAFRMHLSRLDGQKVGPALLEVDGNRVTFRRTGVDEWYVNGPLGLEQGFTVHEDQGHDTLTIELELSAPGYRLDVDTDGARLVHPHRPAIAIRHLHAYDARRRALPTRMRASERGFTLETDVAGAKWPVVVDPLFGRQDQFGEDGD